MKEDKSDLNTGRDDAGQGEAPPGPGEFGKTVDSEAGESPTAGRGIGADPSPPDERMLELENRLEEQTRLAAEYLDLLQRSRAEFQNYRKRVQKEQDLVRKSARAEVLRALLPVLDNLERALSSEEGGEAPDPLRRGIEMIGRQFLDALSSLGVRRIEAVGRPFDPHLHEALAQVETVSHPDGTVVAEFLPGYYLDDSVLREAQVQVARRPDQVPPASCEEMDDIEEEEM